jgi:hypothetical protein
MSTGFPYGSFFSTSGLKYPGVPANPAILAASETCASWKYQNKTTELTEPRLLFSLDFDGESEVCKFDCGAFGFASEEKVFWFEVAMDDPVHMAMVD